MCWDHDQISLRAVSDSQFLTAACSQDRFDVGANIFVRGIIGGLSMPTCHSVPMTYLEFSLYLWLLHSHGGADLSHKLVVSIFLQQLCAYA
jgi:hypothetical protein